jgi:hypothetical protein
MRRRRRDASSAPIRFDSGELAVEYTAGFNTNAGMPLPVKQVTVHYRRLDDIAGAFGARSLEQYLRAALNTLDNGVRIADRLRHRLWQRSGDDNLFINILHDSGTAVFGDLTHFTRGHLQALFDAGLIDEPVVNVEQLPAPEHMEYVHSIMFWLVIGGHVFLIQSQSLRTDALEQYLTWLLANRTRTIVAPAHVILASRFDPAAVGGDLSDLKEIVIGGIVTPAEPREAPLRVTEVTETGEVTARRGTLFGQAREVLAALFGGHAQADEYLRVVPAEAELSVEVHIGYKTRKRRIDRQPLQALERGLRNLGDGELTVVAREGKRAPDGDIRLQQTVAVTVNGSLLDPTDVRAKMMAVYRNFVDTGKIAP